MFNFILISFTAPTPIFNSNTCEVMVNACVLVLEMDCKKEYLFKFLLSKWEKPFD